MYIEGKIKFGAVMKAILEAIAEADPSMVAMPVAANEFATEKKLDMEDVPDKLFVSHVINSLTPKELFQFIVLAGKDKVKLTLEGVCTDMTCLQFLGKVKDNGLSEDLFDTAIRRATWLVPNSDGYETIFRKSEAAFLIERIGQLNDELRSRQQQLLALFGFEDKLYHDGEIIFKKDVESWSETLEKIDKTTHYV